MAIAITIAIKASTAASATNFIAAAPIGQRVAAAKGAVLFGPSLSAVPFVSVANDHESLSQQRLFGSICSCVRPPQLRASESCPSCRRLHQSGLQLPPGPSESMQ